MPYCKLSSTVTHDVSIYHYIFDFPAGMIETSPDLPPDLVDTVRNFLTVYKVIEKCDDTIMWLPPSKNSEIYDVEQDIYNWLRKILPALKSRDKRMQSVSLGALRPSCEKRFHTPRKEKKILYSSSGEKNGTSKAVMAQALIQVAGKINSEQKLLLVIAQILLPWLHHHTRHG